MWENHLTNSSQILNDIEFTNFEVGQPAAGPFCSSLVLRYALKILFCYSHY